MIDFKEIIKTFDIQNLIILAITAIISRIICSPGVIPRSIMKLLNWKERKIFDSIILYKMQDESIKDFGIRLLYLIADAFSPILCVFGAAFLLLAKIWCLIRIVVIGGAASLIIFAFVVSFLLMYIVEISDRIFYRNGKTVKRIVSLINVDMLLSVGLLLLLDRIDDMWLMFSICYYFIILVVAIVVNSIKLPYNTSFVKKVRTFRMIILLLMFIPMYATQFRCLHWFMYFWIIMCYVEYISYVIGIGVKGTVVTIHFKDENVTTHNRIVQCKNGKVKYTLEDRLDVISDENSIEYISYEYHNIIRVRNDINTTVLFRDGRLKKYNTLYYLNNNWIAFNVYEEEKKVVEIYKICDVEKINTMKRKK